MYTKGIFLIASLAGLTGCAQLPQLFKSVEDIANNDCITVKVDRDAFNEKTDCQVSITVKNKD